MRNEQEFGYLVKLSSTQNSKLSPVVGAIHESPLQSVGAIHELPLHLKTFFYLLPCALCLEPSLLPSLLPSVFFPFSFAWAASFCLK